ncbi:MAG: molybdopterin-dependent oxidoreductase [bacterium]|nr:molybdopterin-dependent oxidoreductase [bacterium]
MKSDTCRLTFMLNGEEISCLVPSGRLLLDLLRELGCHSVKFSDERGEGGADTVLMDDHPISAATHLALQVEGCRIETLEGLRENRELKKLADTFLDEGAVQCGYCTPAQMLSLEALRRRNPHPSGADVAEALSTVFCRCTGFVKPLRAGLVNSGSAKPRCACAAKADNSGKAPRYSGKGDELQVIGHDTRRVDGPGLVDGAPIFTGDMNMPGMLHLKILHSPHAHARIRSINIARAEALPGVVEVVTYKDVPVRAYTSAGQGFPEPSPYDLFILSDKARFAGDKIALVAAETVEAAEQACALIDVDYEVLSAYTAEGEAMLEDAPVIHDEQRPTDPQTDILFWPAEPERNVAARTSLDLGDADKGFAAAETIIERSYRSHQVQQCHLEPHVACSYLDANKRLTIIAATQVPFHVRRVVARLLDLPVSRVRVIKPRLGGGFGGKQEILIEELCAFMTMRTGRPMRLELTREEELIFARNRHPARVDYRVGFDGDDRIIAMQMDVLLNTGAYGGHALTVMSVCANKGLSLYPAPNVRHRGTAVYSNMVPAGAYRGYGSPQAFWALETFMEEAALELGVDPLELRLKNVVQVGDSLDVSENMGEGRDGYSSHLNSGAAEECIRRGREAIGWDVRPRGCPPDGASDQSPLRRGIGMALTMQGSGIPGIDMAGAFIKMNEDGGFNLQVGATDLGTGSDTVLAQIAAEVLGVSVPEIIVTSSDTDTTPFDTGAYASSTTYITGGAVKKAAEDLRGRIMTWAAGQLGVADDEVKIADRAVVAPSGTRLTFSEIGTRSLYTENQEQLMASASHLSYDSPPPFAAQFVEVEVDTGTGEVRLLDFVTVLDAGKIINPVMAEGQVEGAVAQGLGFAIAEEITYDSESRVLPRSFREHGYLLPADLPRQRVIFVEDEEPSGPYGAKAVAEICINGPAAAVGNALFDACGVRLRETPLTPEKVLTALRELR